MKKIILLTCLLISSLSYGNSPTLPVEYFGSLPDISGMQLSPDGYKVASKLRVDTGDKKGTAIQVIDLSSSEKNIVLFTDNKTFNINWIKWKGNSTLLVGIYFSEDRAPKNSIKTVKVREQRLLIVDIKTGKYHEAFTRAFQEDMARFGFSEIPLDQDNVIDILDDDPDHILISLPVAPCYIAKVDIKSQGVKIHQERSVRIYRWILDQQHKARIGYEYDNHGTNKITLTASKLSDWKTLWEFEDFSENEVEVLGFGLDPNIIYISAYNKGKKAIFRVNLQDAQLKREVILESPDRDIEGSLVYSRLTRDAIGIKETNSQGITYFDSSFIKLQNGINKALPTTKNYIIGLSDNERRYLVLSTNSSNAGVYLIGDRDKGGLDVVGRRFKNLPSENMSSKQQFKFKARDGLELESFLSTPKNSEAKKYPAVVIVHDGPFWRDTAYADDEYLGDYNEDDQFFNSWTQFLVNRGYAVIQTNFRGSVGKGIEYRNAGFKKWGTTIQEDIEDSVNYFVERGLVDKNSVGIMGFGFGGYSSLQGTVKTPNLYKAAISIGGFSDLDLYAYDRKAFWLSNTWVAVVIGMGSQNLKDTSPLYFTEKITAPILLIHGDEDRRIKPEHSREMFKALQKSKKNVNYIELPNEDHFLTDDVNRLTTFKAIEEFLTKYLPAK